MMLWQLLLLDGYFYMRVQSFIHQKLICFSTGRHQTDVTMFKHQHAFVCLLKWGTALKSGATFCTRKGAKGMKILANFQLGATICLLTQTKVLLGDIYPILFPDAEPSWTQLRAVMECELCGPPVYRIIACCTPVAILIPLFSLGRSCVGCWREAAEV